MNSRLKLLAAFFLKTQNNLSTQTQNLTASTTLSRTMTSRAFLGGLVFVLGFGGIGFGQPWNYDFGTGTGSHTSTTASTTFLPVPTSGTARVRVGTNPGSMTLVNPGLASLGSGSELQFTSNTSSTSTSKFSIYDYTASKTGYVKFNIAFSGGTNGEYLFSLGDGATLSDNNSMNTAQIFAGIKFILGASNAITYNVLNNITYGTAGISNPTTLFVQGTSNVYQVESMQITRLLQQHI